MLDATEKEWLLNALEPRIGDVTHASGIYYRVTAIGDLYMTEELIGTVHVIETPITTWTEWLLVGTHSLACN